MSSITQLISLWHLDDSEALDHLIAIAYDRLHVSAKQALGYYGHSSSIQATELVNELYLFFRNQNNVEYKDSQHFFAIAALKLRQILTARHVKNSAAKRNHGIREDMEAINENPSQQSLIETLVFNNTLDLLEQLDPICTRVAELKIFWEFENIEVAEIVGISESTVYRKWQTAKAVIAKKIKEDQHAPR